MKDRGNDRPSGPGPMEGGLRFEDALAGLEGIVARLEGGDLPLEEALAAFEEGVRLTKICSQRLNEAERKIQILTKATDGRVEERPFIPEEARENQSASGGREGLFD